MVSGTTASRGVASLGPRQIRVQDQFWVGLAGLGEGHNLGV